jgi:2-methylcitrate dehydratase PrpD
MARPAPVLSGQEFLVDKLAAFALSREALPAGARNEGRRILLDQIACQVAAAPLPWSLGYLEAARSLGGEGAATIVYHGDRLRLDQAVFVNGAFGQGAEFDDTHLRSSTHSGAAIVPVVLALCEVHGFSGEEALQAIVVGVETMIRIALAASPHLHGRGHHVPPAVGPFGVAAAAGRLLRLGPEATANAISIAGSHSAGLLEFTHAGGSVKRCHCGIAATNGIRSTMLAAKGITGPRAIFEGQRGFFNTFAGEYDLAKVTEKLGEEFLFQEMGYKPITSAFPAHAPLEAIGLLQKKHGLSADDVEAINVGTSHHSYEHIGAIREPRDITDAHYSVAFGAAVRLLHGNNGFFDYREEDLRDERFLAIARRVTVTIDPVAEEERIRLNTRGAVVTITTKDGRRLEKRVQYSKGHPKNPMSDDELTKKFLDTVGPRLGKAPGEKLAERIWAVEAVKNAGELVRMTLKPHA